MTQLNDLGCADESSRVFKDEQKFDSHVALICAEIEIPTVFYFSYQINKDTFFCVYADDDVMIMKVI